MTEPALDATEDKLFALARAARARIAAAAGAAVVDETGRTYNGATVDLPALRVSALQLAVALAASAGAEHLHGAVIVGADPTPQEVALFEAMAARDAQLLRCGSDKSVLGRWSAP